MTNAARQRPAAAPSAPVRRPGATTPAPVAVVALAPPPRATCGQCHRAPVGRDELGRAACIHHRVIAPHAPDLRGKRFGGLLTARERVGTDAHGNALWRCDCDCGGDRVVTTNALRAGLTRHCGLVRHKRLAPARTTPPPRVRPLGPCPVPDGDEYDALRALWRKHVNREPAAWERMKAGAK
jgi:hypothetical protein